MKQRKNPIRFREAWQGIRALLEDPDDTAQVFKIIRALSGNAGERQFQRFLASEHGPTILAEKRSLVFETPCTPLPFGDSARRRRRSLQQSSADPQALSSRRAVL